MKTTKTGIIRILNAFKYSYDGFIATFKSEEAFRQDILVFIILIPVAIFLPITVVEKLILLSSLFLIIIAELTNTAIEMTIDRISDEIHPLSKIAKDIGSCIVLVSFLYLITVWGTILYTNFNTIISFLKK